MSNAAEEAIAAEHRRYQAMHAGDIAALEAMMTPNFFYTHSNGLHEGSAAYLQRMRDAAVRYHLGRIEEIHADVYGATVLLSGRVRLDVDILREDRVLRMHNRFVSVWVREAGTWRIAGYGSTRLPD